ncbi:unnamed protein product, partial [Rotaria sp. Silwood2]
SPSQLLSKSAHGAAVCWGSEATCAWKNSGSQWEAVSSRIVTVRIECRPVPITIIAAYAPINPSNGVKNNIETCDEFYKSLQATIDKIHKSDMIMIMGNFNARVGVEQANTAGGTVDKHAIDKQNQNGRRLVDICLFNSFIVTNTFFPHKAVHKGTWIHPKTKQWHMLDYILVNRKFRSSVQDVRVHRGTAGGIGTDHHLLRAKIRLHLKCRRKTEKMSKEYFDETLNVDTTLSEEVLQQIPSPTVDDEELSLQDAVPTLDEFVKVIGQIKNKKAPGKDDVPAELLKAGSHYVAEWLHEIIRDVWEQEVMFKIPFVLRLNWSTSIGYLSIYLSNRKQQNRRTTLKRIATSEGQRFGEHTDDEFNNHQCHLCNTNKHICLLNQNEREERQHQQSTGARIFINSNQNNSHQHCQQPTTNSFYNNKNNLHENTLRISKHAIDYASEYYYLPFKLEYQPKLNDKKNGQKIITDLIKAIKPDFIIENPKFNKVILFDLWSIDSNGDIQIIIKTTELYVYLCKSERYPKELNGVRIVPHHPPDLPPQHIAILKWINYSILIDDIKDELNSRYESVFSIEEMAGTMNDKTRHVKIELLNKVEYDTLLNTN